MGKQIRTVIVKSRLSIIFGIVALTAGGFLIQPISSNTSSKHSDPRALKVTTHVSGRINLTEGQELPTSYVGQTESKTLITAGQAQPTTLASADFDEDGSPDLVSGYDVSGRGSEAGLVALHRGNDTYLGGSANPVTVTTRPVSSPFLPEAEVFELPERADLVGVGDFDNDAHQDVVTAALDGKVLHLLAGNGHGGFAPAETIPLPGVITAMTVGEINHADHVADIAVAIVGADGPQVLVFESPEGALTTREKRIKKYFEAAQANPFDSVDGEDGRRKLGHRPVLTVVPSLVADTANPTSPLYSVAEGPAFPDPETFPMPAEVTSLAMGQLNGGSVFDLAASAGRELVIVGGRDRKLLFGRSAQAAVPEARVDRLEFDFGIEALAIGNFVWNRENRASLALLSQTGEVHVVTPRGMVREPWSESQRKDRETKLDRLRKLEAGLSKGVQTTADNANAQRTLVRAERLKVYAELKAAGLVSVMPAREGAASAKQAAWEISNSLAVLTNKSSALAAQPRRKGMAGLVVAQISGQTTDDLIVLDETGEQMHIVGGDTATGDSSIPGQLSTASKGREFTTLASLDTVNAPMAALAMRLNRDARSDLVVLRKGETFPLAITTAAMTTFTVKSTGDADNGSCGGNCTLRDAIKAANANPGADNIVFDLGSGTPSISLTGNLPQIIDSVTIDGNTGGATRVEINGNNVASIGLNIASNACAVRSLVIKGVTDNGVTLNGSSGSVVAGSIIGGPNTGVAAGIALANCTNTLIGGTAPGNRNVIGKFRTGISVSFNAAGIRVEGNFVGTNETATDEWAVGDGIFTTFASGLQVGGTTAGAGNVVWAQRTAVSVEDNAFVEGNLIGTDITGTKALNVAGVLGIEAVTTAGGSRPVVGGTSPLARNLISGLHTGVEASPGDVVRNLIGTDITGTRGVANSFGSGNVGNSKIGVNVKIGGGLIEGNLVSLNQVCGIYLKLVENVSVVGNLVGTDITGTVALKNGVGVATGCTDDNPGQFCNTGGAPPFQPSGVVIGGPGLERNIVSGNVGRGIWNTQRYAEITVENNYVGVDITGSAALGNGRSGLEVAAKKCRVLNNVVSANGNHGMVLDGLVSGDPDQRAEGNKVGTNAAGTAALGNASDGVQVGFYQSLSGNLISGNLGDGVETTFQLATVEITDLVIQNNKIGTDISGVNPIPNGLDGLDLTVAQRWLIGGSTGFGNIIAFNGMRGIVLTDSIQVQILGNSFFANGGGGIVLVNSNQNRPAPVLTSAMLGTFLDVTGTLDAPAGAYLIQFFGNVECDSSGAGEGKVFLGQYLFNKSSSGVQSFTAPGLTLPGVQLSTVTATATSNRGDSTGETTQFSNCLPVCQVTINCPGNVTVNTDPQMCSAQVSFDPAATASCPGGSTGPIAATCRIGNQVITSPHTFPVGTTPVTCSAGTSQCSFTVTVNDNAGPVINVPSGIVQSADPGQCQGSVAFNVSATDGCGVEEGPRCFAGVEIVSPHTFPIGTTTVVCTARDIKGNESQAQFTVTVVDNEPAKLVVPQNIVRTTEENKCSASVEFAAIATDNCFALDPSYRIGADTFIFSPYEFPKGTTTVFVSVFDGAAHLTTGSFTVTVNDTQPPALTVPANITRSTDANQCSASVPFNVSSNDNCDGSVAPVCKIGNTTITSPYSFPKGVTTVTCTATDSAANTSSPGSFTVTVNDSQAPAVACAKVPAQSASANGSCAALVPDVGSLVRAQASDNCTAAANLVITQSPVQGSSVSGTGPHPITVTVKDADNNSISCVVGFVINDTTPPAIMCPGNIVKQAEPNLCSAIATFAPTAIDNCSGVGIPVCTPPSGSAFPGGTTTVSCSVRDAANNQSAPCSFTVQVVDTQLPSIACPTTQTRVTGNPGDTTVTVTYPAPTASDNCSVQSVVCNPPSGSAFPLGTTTVTCVATDGSGNTRACSFLVTTFDICLQDDSSPGTVLMWNSVTGDYRFCCEGTPVVGRGTVTRRGSLFTLTHNATDRRVNGSVDGSQYKGNASLQTPPGVTKCTIMERDTRNNTCSCM